MSDEERLAEIRERLAGSARLSTAYGRNARADVEWLLSELDARDKRIAELEAELERRTTTSRLR